MTDLIEHFSWDLLLAERKSKAINVYDFRIRFRIRFFGQCRTRRHTVFFSIAKWRLICLCLMVDLGLDLEFFFSFIACQMKIKRLAFGKARNAVPLVKNIRSRSRI